MKNWKKNLKAFWEKKNFEKNKNVMRFERLSYFHEKSSHFIVYKNIINYKFKNKFIY